MPALSPAEVKVIVSDSIADKGVEMMRQAGLEVDVKTGLAPEELERIIGGYDVIVVRSATKVRKPLIEAARNLKLIVRAGVGLDNIDVEYARAQGIEVTNTPTASSNAVAELTVSYLFALARRLPQTTASMRAGKWEKKKFRGSEIEGKTLGLVGYGRIGWLVAKKALALGMDIVAYDPYVADPRGLDMEFVSLEELFQRSDYISMHLPLTDETRDLIAGPQFEMMKDGVRLVNCARGGTINEDALYEAIVSGKVVGAALDVYLEEPVRDNKLFELDEVIGSPHVGAATAEAQHRVSVEVAEKVIGFQERLGAK
ncbi:MAG: 3-phosphoglycerate dehydrogenase [Anaerolineae bacterium]|nr:3-phosphoglycerate dehydrogenase [Anaerolineae bacterium]